MNQFQISSTPNLPRMWMAPNTPFQYQDTALEAAHLKIERLQSANAVQQLLLDEATSRISDLAKYRAKAATIIVRLTEKLRALRRPEARQRIAPRDAVAIPRSMTL
jgi:hypothetical protein